MEVERNARWCGSPAGIRDARASLRFARLVMRQRPAQPTTTATREPPPVFTAARSERGLEMVAKVGDWWFVDYDKRATNPQEYLEGVARAIECDVDASRIVTTWDVGTLLDWTSRRG